MKKITSSATLGGAPVNKGDLRTVFNDEIWDALEALLSPFITDTQGLIVSGCVLSANGGNWDISEGIVFIDGEFMRFDAVTNQSLPKYIKAATAVNDTRTFADGSSATLFITKKADLAGSAPGAGQYIAITSSTDPDDRRWKKSIQSTTKLTTKVYQIGDWNMETASAGTNTVLVNHTISDLSKIRGVQTFITNDTGLTSRLLDASDVNGTDKPQGSTIIQSTTFLLERLIGGTFDGPNFNLTPLNRGWVVVTVEE